MRLIGSEPIADVASVTCGVCRFTVEKRKAPPSTKSAPKPKKTPPKTKKTKVGGVMVSIPTDDPPTKAEDFLKSLPPGQKLGRENAAKLLDTLGE